MASLAALLDGRPSVLVVMVWQLADPALLQDIMVGMQAATVPAGAVTYSIWVKASCNTKNVDSALSLFQQLRRVGLAFGEVAFNTLLLE